MDTQILNLLKENRSSVEKTHAKVVKQATEGYNYITSKSFFFKVVAQHFEGMSTIMINKVKRGGVVVFYRELWKAIENAEYACAKPERDANRGLFSKSA